PFDAIKLNYLRMRFRLGDAFVIVIALYYGALPATLTAAILGCIVSLRDFKEDKRRINLLLVPAASASAIFLGTKIIELSIPAVPNVPPLMGLLALVYYLLYNGFLSIGLAADGGVSIASIWRERWSFTFLSLFFSSLGAVAVYGAIKNVGFYA